jgi:hypothetical protein
MACHVFQLAIPNVELKLAIAARKPAPSTMTEPISGPPRWLVRTLVTLAVLALFVEFALYAGAIFGD